VRPRIEQALAALRAEGIICRCVGSFARPDAHFGPGSDIDILIESRHGHSDAELWGRVSSLLPGIAVDVIFADALAAEDLAYMLGAAR
jgi:predicted nucleotidyltransferase